MRRRVRFGDTAVGGALVGLLRSAEESGRTGDLLAWLRAPGVLERPELADALELETRRRGVVTAAGAVALWQERRWPLEALDRLREASGHRPLQLIERAERELGRLFAAPRRRLAAMLEPEELQDAAALQVAQRALGELRELARSSPELAPADAAELGDVLAALELPAGEARQGAVAVLDPLALRARRVRALFLCALQEGAFPAPQRAQPVLGEEERRRLAETGGPRLPLPADGLAAERYLFYAAVSRPEERLYLSWHAADEEGNPLARSLFVEDLCDLLHPSLGERTARRALGELSASVAAAPGAPLPARAAGLAPLSEERVLASVRERPFSASSLEAWIGCPTKWFVERLLRPNAFEPDPEALARGGLAHAALKQTFEALRERTGTARPKPASLPLARELLAQALREHEPRHPLSVAPERLAAARRRLQVDLERYLARAAEMDGALEPAHLELGFGFPEEPDALPALELGEGVSLRGRIDRIDVGPGGEAVVYDYKGRAAPPAARWLSDGNVQVALYMHAAERLLGLWAVGGFYQPLAGSDGRPRGVLDAEADVGIECVRGDALESSELAELLREVLARAREAAVQAGRGELQARPATCAWGGGCAYPTICRCEG
jgi:RecB family exonuclease